MENLKIRVNSADESKEAQELFFKLGGSWAGYKKINNWPEIKQLYLGENYITFSNDINFFVKAHKEITLPELRAMVNPMKEYLDANRNYEFVLSTEKDDGFIEIPEGAEIAIRFKDDEEVVFYKNDGKFRFPETGTSWKNDSSWTMEQLLDENHSADGFDLSHDILWQRDQDEPFLTPECTLNDQYAEIERVGKAIKVKSCSDSDHALDAMSFGFIGFGAAQAIGRAKDNVNHPSHYADSAIECIDAMEAMMTAEQFIGYLRGNLFKYQWRYEKKNGIEDLKKAQWYLEKLTVKIAEKNAPF